ncbi:MAG: 2-hydroxyacid dehydrogenase [Sulfitobacter sp.]|jgi:lactate dehydrogenase-like 2-hydroxyacid dehydrogenase|uniref:2-hydroxyacid dehydrogenase n=2 Tax=Sulfitobacter sp. TaxID=1903071 RepID=UPI000C647A9E|nr:hydroxyacid dehydrogenase [Roseobacter sp.]|tara:strand:- start:4792 stop:5739 length:948 start_codon:yes stop_codon:yes gene_type:complete
MPDVLVIGGATEAMLARMSEKFTVHKWAEHDMDWLEENAEKITHVVTNGHDGVRPEIMAALPNLQMISCYGVGYDAIDTTEAVRRGIMVTHTPGVLNDEVATTAVMLVLACYRELLRDDAYVRSGEWEKKGSAPLTRSLENQTIGILGLGRIGQAIATKLAPWNPTTVYHSRTKKDVPYTYYDNLEAMAADSDILICITPGGAETRKIVNAEVLAALGPKGTLINVARGSVVDETALIDALQSGKLGWAGLDVFEQEPKVPQALRDLPNTVLLPHVGSATVETRTAMANLTVENLLQHLETGTVATPVPECATDR